MRKKNVSKQKMTKGRLCFMDNQTQDKLPRVKAGVLYVIKSVVLRLAGTFVSNRQALAYGQQFD